MNNLDCKTIITQLMELGCDRKEISRRTGINYNTLCRMVTSTKNPSFRRMDALRKLYEIRVKEVKALLKTMESK